MSPLHHPKCLLPAPAPSRDKPGNWGMICLEDSGLFRLRPGQKGLFQGRAFHAQRRELPGGWITSAVRTWVLSGSTNVWSPGLTARTSLPCAEKPRERGPYLHIDPLWPVQRGGGGTVLCPRLEWEHVHVGPGLGGRGWGREGS